jgi:hypothetical protein
MAKDALCKEAVMVAECRHSSGVASEDQGDDCALDGFPCGDVNPDASFVGRARGKLLGVDVGSPGTQKLLASHLLNLLSRSDGDNGGVGSTWPELTQREIFTRVEFRVYYAAHLSGEKGGLPLQCSTQGRGFAAQRAHWFFKANWLKFKPDPPRVQKKRKMDTAGSPPKRPTANDIRNWQLYRVRNVEAFEEDIEVVTYVGEAKFFFLAILRDSAEPPLRVVVADLWIPDRINTAPGCQAWQCDAENFNERNYAFPLELVDRKMVVATIHHKDAASPNLHGMPTGMLSRLQYQKHEIYTHAVLRY